MALEIERRFLVDPKRLPKLRKGRLQTQGYLNEQIVGAAAEVRVRIEEKSATLTIKHLQNSLVRQEFEYPIPLSDAHSLLKLTDKKVSKVRHTLTVDGKKWVIDFFQGSNFPLIIAELELRNEKEKFSLPLWITKEITSDLSYTAVNLAFKPFQSWKRKDLKKAS